MGWLEILALLKRLGPTLSRMLPMLEMFVATRGSSNANTDTLDRLAGEIKDQLAAASTNHAALTETLSTQARQVGALIDDLRHIRDAEERAAARLLEVETQVSTLAKAVQQARQLLYFVLFLCLATVAALIVLLFRR